MTYFTVHNTDYQFNNSELAILNERVEVVLHAWQSNAESDTYADDVKNACDLVSNSWPNAPDLL